MSVECPEVEEYRNNPWGMRAARGDGVGSGGYVSFTPKILADAALAELEQKNSDLLEREIILHAIINGLKAERDALLKSGDRMEKAIGLYFDKDRIDPMNDARFAWHKLRAAQPREGGG